MAEDSIPIFSKVEAILSNTWLRKDGSDVTDLLNKIEKATEGNIKIRFQKGSHVICGSLGCINAVHELLLRKDEYPHSQMELFDEAFLSLNGPFSFMSFDKNCYAKHVQSSIEESNAEFLTSQNYDKADERYGLNVTQNENFVSNKSMRSEVMQMSASTESSSVEVNDNSAGMSSTITEDFDIKDANSNMDVNDKSADVNDTSAGGTDKKDASSNMDMNDKSADVNDTSAGGTDKKDASSDMNMNDKSADVNDTSAGGTDKKDASSDMDMNDKSADVNYTSAGGTDKKDVGSDMDMNDKSADVNDTSAGGTDKKDVSSDMDMNDKSADVNDTSTGGTDKKDVSSDMDMNDKSADVNDTSAGGTDKKDASSDMDMNDKSADVNDSSAGGTDKKDVSSDMDMNDKSADVNDTSAGGTDKKDVSSDMDMNNKSDTIACGVDKQDDHDVSENNGVQTDNAHSCSSGKENDKAALEVNKNEGNEISSDERTVDPEIWEYMQKIKHNQLCELLEPLGAKYKSTLDPTDELYKIRLVVKDSSVNENSQNSIALVCEQFDRLYKDSFASCEVETVDVKSVVDNHSMEHVQTKFPTVFLKRSVENTLLIGPGDDVRKAKKYLLSKSKKSGRMHKSFSKSSSSSVDLNQSDKTQEDRAFKSAAFTADDSISSLEDDKNPKDNLEEGLSK